MRETWVPSLGQEDPLELEMATNSSTLVWKIAWTEDLVGHSPLGRKELDTTERTHRHPTCQAGDYLCLFLKLWGGQKVGSGFSLGAYETQMNFWPIQ